jgi:hypothetical protein
MALGIRHVFSKFSCFLLESPVEWKSNTH